ncbi:MAG: hypothetical protein IMY71_09880 [Bacteroidetes bacterium]|nr:hypothetical protein [Bacteroidota bacterium]
MRILNIILITLLLSIITLSCSNNSNDLFYTKGSVIVCGEINNYVPQKDYQSILIRVYNILKSAHHVNAHLVTIDSITGKFRTNFDVQYDSPIIFDYGNFMLHLVAKANDSIYITFNNDDLINRDNRLIIPGTFEISSNNRLNIELVDFFKKYSSSDFYIQPQDPEGHTKKEFLEILKQNINEKSSILKNYIKQTGASHDLSEYLYNSLIYGAANYIIDYKLMNKESYDRDILYDFSLFPLNNPIAINDGFYRAFIYNYFMDIFWSNDTIVNLYEEGNIGTAYRKYFKIIESSPADQIIKDILYSSSLDELIALDKTAFLILYPDIIGLVENNIIKQFIHITYSETVEQLSSQKNSNFKLRSFESLLTKINTDLKKDYYLIDIWNPTCGPCVTLFPKLSELSNELSNSNIGVLYLCTPYDEVKWSKFIGKLPSTKGHYLLNKAQYDKLQVDLKFSGIPKHFIMDNQGIVIHNSPDLEISTIKELIKNH